MNQKLRLESLVIEPKSPKKVDACIIWLHGLGADGHDFKDIATQLRLPDSLGIRFILPHAPIRPVTLNRGMLMRAWYDIYDLDKHAREDQTGIQNSQSALELIIQEQIESGIPAHKIILSGFSQGGALALYTGLRFGQPLAGIIGLSTYLPLANTLAIEKNPNNQTTPILLTHGIYDEILPLELAQSSKEYLQQAGCSVQWVTYNMGHQLCLEEIVDIREWIISKALVKPKVC